MASAYLSMFSRNSSLTRIPFTSPTHSYIGTRGLNLAFPKSRQLLRSCVARGYSLPKRPGSSLLTWRAGGVASVGLGLSLYASTKTVYCEPGSTPATPPKGPTPPPDLPPLPPPPPSSVNLYELSFGTVCGICAGVFIKKGAKALAFAFGGVFVLLQYLGSKSIIKVDWGRASSRFEDAFYTKEANGVRRPPNVGSAWRWLIDFLTADFQPRASFIAGLALGMRIG